MEIKEQDDFSEIKDDLDDLNGKFLTFYTDNQLFGIPIADVVQIVGMQEIIKIPEYPEYAKGIISLRGSVIPVIDMRLRLKRDERAYDERTCTIVTSIDEMQVGLIVDGVDEVADVDPECVSASPKMSDDHTEVFVTGIASLENKVILLLDTGKLLHYDELQALKQTQI